MTPRLDGIAQHKSGLTLLWGINTKALVAEWNYGQIMVALRDKRFKQFTYSRKYSLPIPRGKVLSASMPLAPTSMFWHEGELEISEAYKLLLNEH